MSKNAKGGIRCMLGFHDLVLYCDGKYDYVRCKRCGFRTPDFPQYNNARADDLWGRALFYFKKMEEKEVI